MIVNSQREKGQGEIKVKETKLQCITECCVYTSPCYTVSISISKHSK